MLPLANQEFEFGEDVTLQASAYDSDGTIQQVEFFQNGLLIGGTNQSPYTLTWQQPEVGEYQLTALATDNHGTATYSAPVSIKVLDNEQVFYIHTDHLNTPRVITDDNGDEVWRWDNEDPFGNNQANESPTGKKAFTFNLRFPGQYYDKETGLHYNYFRDYDPETGRYITSDPIGLAGGLNTYGYVGGNPLSFVDPYGLSPDLLLSTDPSAYYEVEEGKEPTQSCDCEHVVAGVLVLADILTGGPTGEGIGPAIAILATKKAATAATKNMLGRNGVQTASKTIWKGKGKERLDVENPNPGQRPGQLHYQDNDNNKWLYDPETKTFPGAPKSVNKLLKNPTFCKAIEKGMKQYLGEE